MTARLTNAITICDAAEAILRKTLTFPDPMSGDEQENPKDVGVEPMLLALAMELALKAWWVFDYDNPTTPRSHNLAELFDSLNPESRTRLEMAFKREVAPTHPNFFFAEYGIGEILFQHRNAFIDWRYLHERKSINFEQAAFVATLEVVISEFRKRYRVVPASPTPA